MKELVPGECGFLTHLESVSSLDVQGLRKAQESYGSSWKQRGGVGAFMMLARKWDRLERAVERHGWDIFAAMDQDDRSEGVIDDIRDLRRYLLLVESEAIQLEITCAVTGHRDNLPSSERDGTYEG